MAKIINLRTARKQRARRDKSAKASENSVKFGRSKAERRADGDPAARQARQLDQLRLERPRSDPNDDKNSP